MAVLNTLSGFPGCHSGANGRISRNVCSVRGNEAERQEECPQSSTLTMHSGIVPDTYLSFVRTFLLDMIAVPFVHAASGALIFTGVGALFLHFGTQTDSFRATVLKDNQGLEAGSTSRRIGYCFLRKLF